MNSNLIIRRIDQTCDTLGGEDLLKQKGFYHVVNYVDIVKKLNDLPFEGVLNTLRNLILDGNLYQEFALHLLEGGMLHDKFFELDEDLNQTKNNLNYQLRSELDFEDDDMSEFSISPKERDEMLRKEIESIEVESRRLYESNNIKKHTKSLIHASEHLGKIREITSNTTIESLEWIEKNITEMSDTNYGKFMVLISKIREYK
tara:strand:- start:174 stop:779 length:606 start_codon:yes stop_codon:yes gene_type:complete